MASEVELCKMALSNIRARSINSLDEASVEAQTCKLWYPLVRDQMLRESPWSFTRVIQALALRTEDPLQWVYAYQYPADCLRLYYVTADFGFKDQSAVGIAYRDRFDPWFIEPEKAVPFEIQIGSSDRQLVLTDQRDAYAVYTKKVTDPNTFPVDFYMMLSWYLASQISVPLLGLEGGRAARSDAMQMYQSLRETAIAANGNEAKPPRTEQNDFVTARTT